MSQGMYTDLKGKVAVITGGSKGIGTAIAERLGSEKMHVIINYRSDEDGADEAVELVEQAGGKAVAVQSDVSTEEGIECLIKAAVKHFGTIDAWINNAGMENQHPTHQLALEDWQQVLDVNLTGVFIGSKAALAYFIKEDKPGVILTISSVHEQIPWPTFAHYTASKFGVKGFTQAIAMEYASRNIRVNSIGPGAIETPINAEKFEDDQQRAETEQMIPMKRIGDPKEVAAAAAWLLSNEASYVTGVTLFVDGGMTLYPAFQDGKG